MNNFMFKSDRAIVQSVNLMYMEKIKKYAAVMVIAVETEKKYILLENDESKFHPMKRAQEIAGMIEVPFIDETKEFIQIGFHELKVSTLHNLKFGERLKIADFTIEHSAYRDKYFYTYPGSCPSVCKSAKEIVNEVKSMIDAIALQ